MSVAPQPTIAALRAYDPGHDLVALRRAALPERLVELGSNENPLGPSPALRRLFSDIGELARLYPDPQGRALCARLADSLGLSHDFDANEGVM